MKLKDKLPVSYLLFTKRGRINRRTYWVASIFIWTMFYVLFNLIDFVFSYSATLSIYPLLFWALVATATKRLHDVNLSGFTLGLILVPVFGPLLLFFFLAFKKGTRVSNRYGAAPNTAADYYKNNDAESIPHLKTGERIINDFTQLNPVLVAQVVAPETVSELQYIVRNAAGAISVGGGRFSMGGQTASPYSTHIDMRKLNKIIEFSAEKKCIKVQAGIRWCDIQRYIDEHDLSVKIMQTYANFTVGGSLSVNCHGRYLGSGPVILSVRSLDVMLASGEILHTSPRDNAELFYASVGCYNAVGIIVHAEVELEDNLVVERTSVCMRMSEYKKFFTTVSTDKAIVFHNADIYPPAYTDVRAVSWKVTDRKPTEPLRLMPLAAAYPVERYFIGAFANSAFGKWRRQHLIDPLLYFLKKRHWRNYEAGYDVLELEPASRKEKTYVLQEYFVPVHCFTDFAELMAEIFKRYKVNVINISIRHARPDNGSMLAWATTEVFAFVVWYRQLTTEPEKNKVGVWTREVIDAALSLGGSYYLPYQPHATHEQFYKAYPGAKNLFELKRKLDPKFKFRNVLWDTYYENQQL